MGQAHKNKIVLIAEDSPADRALFHYALATAKPDFEVTFVQDGVEALEYIRGQGNFTNRTKFPAPEILVLDIAMPRMSGIDVLHELGSSREAANLKIFVLTGIEDPRTAAAATAAEAKFMQKPHDLEVWTEFIRGLDFLLKS